MNYACTDEMKTSIRRIEGQIRGVLRLMDEGKSCKEIVAQLTAVRNASDKMIARIVADNLQKCVRAERTDEGDSAKVVQEAVDLLVKSR